MEGMMSDLFLLNERQLAGYRRSFRCRMGWRGLLTVVL